MASSEAPVEIVAYDSSWPGLFTEEAEVLRRALAPWLAGPIEHIGSTAIPGLAAKPIIDIMAGVETLDASRPAVVTFNVRDFAGSERLGVYAQTPRDFLRFLGVVP